MNILKNKPVLMLYKYSVITFRFLNKYLYIISILSILNTIYSTLRNNKFYQIISVIFKLIFVINLIVGTGYIIYFIDFTNPINSTYLLYYDILKPYIDILKNFWNDLINFNIEESIISNVKETNTIKDQIKAEIKKEVKEALDEILDERKEYLKSKAKTDLYKNIALMSIKLILQLFLIF